MKIVTIALAILSLVLSALCVYLYYGRARYVPQNRAGLSPFVVLDTRTGIACWSGPPAKIAEGALNPIDEAIANSDASSPKPKADQKGSYNLPLCYSK